MTALKTFFKILWVQMFFYFHFLFILHNFTRFLKVVTCIN